MYPFQCMIYIPWIISNFQHSIFHHIDMIIFQFGFMFRTTFYVLSYSSHINLIIWWSEQRHISSYGGWVEAKWKQTFAMLFLSVTLIQHYNIWTLFFMAIALTHIHTHGNAWHFNFRIFEWKYFELNNWYISMASILLDWIFIYNVFDSKWGSSHKFECISNK